MWYHLGQGCFHGPLCDPLPHQWYVLVSLITDKVLPRVLEPPQEQRPTGLTLISAFFVFYQ